MKKLEEMIRARILHKLLSQRIGGEVRVEVLKGNVNPKVSQSKKEKFKCFYYDKEDHINRNYKAWKNKQKEDKNQKKSDDENTASVIVLEDEVLAIGQDDCCTVLDPYVEWVIDSAASCHVTPRKELFTSYKVGNFERVKMGNDKIGRAHV